MQVVTAMFRFFNCTPVLALFSVLVATFVPQLSLGEHQCLPQGFVYLHDVAPSITEEMRYYGSHNFVGHRINGYRANKCILTREAAMVIAKVQEQLNKQKLSLKVYDCYRPQRAVNNFIIWSQHNNQRQMKQEFFPHVNKSDLFTQGYISARSKHSSGSTVDLTIIPYPAPLQAKYTRGQNLFPCYYPYDRRFHDNSIDMGTGFDCMDERSHMENRGISKSAYKNRMLLVRLMKKYGFDAYTYEWWHFTLQNEPFLGRAFDFPIMSKIQHKVSTRRAPMHRKAHIVQHRKVVQHRKLIF